MKAQVHNLKAIYKSYVAKLLKENPTYWTLYTKPERAHTVYGLSESNKVLEIISFKRFRAIFNLWFKLAQDKVIAGEVLQMKGIGCIKAVRVERNFNNKMVNFHETMKQPIDPVTNKRKQVIFFDSPDWCRIRWERNHDMPWIEVYKFKPAEKGVNGFKNKFKAAIRNNRPLQLSYPYIPFIPK